MLISRSDRGLLARWWFTIDRLLLTALLVLMAIGVFISMAASPPVAERVGYDSFHFVRQQLVFAVIAAAVLVGSSFLDQVWARRLSLVGLIASFVLMAAALKFGPEIKGAHRWIYIGPFNLQPSEFAKPFFVTTCAWLLAERTRRPDIPAHIFAFVLYGVMLGLLVVQPDFGQSTLTTLVFLMLLVIFGIPWSYFAGLFCVALSAGYGAYLLVPHVASRIDRFLSPEKGDTFQVDTAIQAFQNGGLLGTGPGGGTAKQILPDAHTDFIFAVLGEEFGFVACLLLILLIGFIVLRLVVRASAEKDPFAALAIAGLTGIFGFQAVINMAVNVSLLPAKGMTLPFVSYGGSSLIGMAFTMGLALAFARRKPNAALPQQAWRAAAGA